MDHIPEVRNPPGASIDSALPPPFVKIVGPQFMVWGMAGEPIKDALHERVRDGDNGPLFPTAGSKALIQRCDRGPLRTHGRMRELCQDGP
jgi:hypothetical protein